jgi:hypothetical protein
MLQCMSLFPGEKRTWRGRLKSVVHDPRRHLSRLICCGAQLSESYSLASSRSRRNCCWLAVGCARAASGGAGRLNISALRLIQRRPLPNSAKLALIQLPHIRRRFRPATILRFEMPGERETPTTLPDKFVLLLSNDGKFRRQCKVIWRTENAVGIEFDPPFPTKLNLRKQAI